MEEISYLEVVTRVGIVSKGNFWGKGTSALPQDRLEDPQVDWHRELVLYLRQKPR